MKEMLKAGISVGAEGFVSNIRPVCCALVFFAALALIGCGNKNSNEVVDHPPTAVVDPATAGTITGMVTLDGRPPVFHPIDMSAEPACVKANSTTVIPPVVVTGARGALAGVVVYAKSGLGRYRYDTPTQPAVLDQRGCMYDPRVLAVMIHQGLEVHNQDPTVHNIHATPRDNRSWNRSEEPGEPPFQTSFARPELAIPILCNIHPWMRAFLFVFDNPYFDVTSKSGTFQLKAIPPGTYTIAAWQEHYGTQYQTVTLSSKGSKSIVFMFHTPPSH